MVENKPARVDGVVRRTRRRVKVQAVSAGLRVVFTFLLLAAVAGFGYGMWAEVAASPAEYAKRESNGDADYLEHWSIKAGKLFATMQGFKTEFSMPGSETARVEEPEPPVYADPRLFAAPVPRHEPMEQKPEPKNLVNGNPEPERKTLPKPEPTPGRTIQPTPPPPQPPSRAEVYAAETAKILKAARRNRSTALHHYKQAGPTAPSRGRRAATKLTLTYLKRSQLHYKRAMQREMSASDRRRASIELTNIQKMIFWCHKFLPAGGR